MGREEEKEVAVTPSTEDVVQALLDYFVEPVLPPKRSFEPPSLDQQLSVAKQVHAVALLYSYYQRKLQPHLEFLTLVSFCKLVLVLKPALMPFMKLMHQSDYSQLDGLQDQLSPTEKAIMDACDFSRILDLLKCPPGVEGWPITKVAVLLIDASMENCWLLRSTVTQGVWSVIEKDLDVSNIRSDGKVESKSLNKKRRTFKQPQRYNQNIDASGLQQLALLAVNEVAGIDQSNIKVLESHVVYSLSEEKAAACFYVMQCIQSASEGFQFPIKDVVERLQGPLVKKTSNGWKTSTVAEYFQLLPYAGILSDLISRALLVNSSGVYQATYSPNQAFALNRGETNGSSPGCQNKDKILVENVVKVHQPMTTIPSSESSKSVSTIGNKHKVDSVSLGTIGYKDEEVSKGSSQVSTMAPSIQCGKLGRGCAPVHSQSKSQHHKNLQAKFASEERISSDSTLAALLREREKLVLQKHNVEKNIVLCDKTIQTIVNGGRDSLALKLDAIIEACCFVHLRDADVQYWNNQQFEGQGLFLNAKRNQLREAALAFGSPCEKLDQICHWNNWVLPTYSVVLSDGGFQSTVTLKGLDFEASAQGDVCSGCVREARDSAAACMVTKLQEMKNQLKRGDVP